MMQVGGKGIENYPCFEAGEEPPVKSLVTAVALERIKPQQENMLDGYIREVGIPNTLSCLKDSARCLTASALVTCIGCAVLGLIVLLEVILFAPFGHLMFRGEWSFMPTSQDPEDSSGLKDNALEHFAFEGLAGGAVLSVLAAAVVSAMLLGCVSVWFVKSEIGKSYSDYVNEKKELEELP